MKNIWTIAKKEWHYLFTNPLGYIFAGILLLVANWLFFGDLFLIGQAEMKNYWGVMTFLMSIFVPAIAMGVIADEKKSGTWEVILTTPINEIELIAGKMLGVGMYLALVVGLSWPVAATLALIGRPDFGQMVGGFLGAMLLAWAYLALSVFMSSLTNQSIVAFLSSTVILLVNSLLGQEGIAGKFPSLIKNILTAVSLNARASMFTNGLIEIGSLVFFVSWILIFSILSVLSLKARDK